MFLRHASVNESTLIYDLTVEGHATGEIAYQVPASGTSGLIGLLFNVVDANYNTVTASNYTVVVWNTDDTWTDSGNIYAVSKYELIDGGSTTTWDAIGVFQYSDYNNYTVYASENPVDLGSDDDNYYFPSNSSMLSLMSLDDQTAAPLDVLNSIHLTIAPKLHSIRVLSDTDDNGLDSFYFLVYGTGDYGGDWYTW